MIEILRNLTVIAAAVAIVITIEILSTKLYKANRRLRYLTEVVEVQAEVGLELMAENERLTREVRNYRIKEVNAFFSEQ